MPFAKLCSALVVAAMCAAPATAIASDASVSPRDAYFDAREKPTLSYRLQGDGSVDVRIQVVDRETGDVVRSWLYRQVGEGDRQTRAWSGLGPDGKVTPDGRYKFVVREQGATRSVAVAKFRWHEYAFPIPGPHSYRGGEGDFGAPRPGRIHEGKDVWAACGQELIAAHGGTVKRVGYDPVLYGNFAVIDGRRTGTDLFYVHMLRTATVGEGDRIRAGEAIGQVGATGNAASVGCMLHLEVWPDGFRHGDPIDPEPLLRAWDDYS